MFILEGVVVFVFVFVKVVDVECRGGFFRGVRLGVDGMLCGCMIPKCNQCNVILNGAVSAMRNGTTEDSRFDRLTRQRMGISASIFPFLTDNGALSQQQQSLVVP